MRYLFALALGLALTLTGCTSITSAPQATIKKQVGSTTYCQSAQNASQAPAQFDPVAGTFTPPIPFVPITGFQYSPGWMSYIVFDGPPGEGWWRLEFDPMVVLPLPFIRKGEWFLWRATILDPLTETLVDWGTYQETE